MTTLDQLRKSEAKEKLTRAHEKLQAIKNEPMMLLAGRAKASPAKMRAEVVGIMEEIIAAMWATLE